MALRTNVSGQRLASAAGAIYLAALAACATPSEPCSYNFRDQQFLGTAQSVLTNEYQRCTEHLLEQLADLEVQVESARRSTDQLEKLAQDVGAEAQLALNRLAEANRESRAALDALNRLRADSKKDRARLNEFIKQQAELERRKKTATDAALDGEVERLNAEIEALQRQQKALRDAIDAELAS
jgi:chromosome segregation ATPase